MKQNSNNKIFLQHKSKQETSLQVFEIVNIYAQNEHFLPSSLFLKG